MLEWIKSTRSGIKTVGRTMVVNAFVAKYDVVKLDGTGIFGLWQQRRVKDLLVQQGLGKALYRKTRKP